MRSDLAFAEWVRENAPRIGVPDITPPEERARRVEGCGRSLEFHTLPDRAGQPTRLHAGHFCQQSLLCSKCARARASKAVKAYAPKIASCVQDGGVPYLLTLTLRNGPDLAERFDRLRAGLTKLNGRRKKAQQRCTGDPLALIDGWAGSFEFKRGERSGEWHPHLHLLVIARRRLTPMEAQAVKAAWVSINPDESVPAAQDLRPITDAGGILEVFKYALKLAELDHADRWEAFRVLKGRKLIVSCGCLRGVIVPHALEDDPFDDAELERFFRTIYGRTDSGYRLVSAELVVPERPDVPRPDLRQVPY